MLQTTLPGTDLRVSRFSYGTSSLLRVGSAKARADLLAAACDYGYTHFDTAPYYGFGVTERDIGDVLSRRSGVTVTSKVGLYSPGGERQPTSFVFARKIAGKAVPALSRPIADWSVARGRKSLSDSLRRLKRDCLDLYLLHEPDRAVLGTDEWLRWLESERGRVRYFGVAVTTERLQPFLAAGDPLAGFVQTEDDVAGRGVRMLADHGRPPQITYGYIRDALAQGRRDIEAVLATALARNAQGSIIVGTTRRERMHRYADLADAAPSDEPRTAAPEPNPAR